MNRKPNKLLSNINLPNTNLARKRLLKSNTQRNLFKITAKHKKIGQHKTYFIKTYGCQLNTRDSEDIAGILESMCYRPAKTIETADLVILNTCAVRENAEKKVFGKIGFFKNKKQKHPDFLFGVCGCMCQEVGVVNKIVQKLKHVDFVFGTHNIYMLPDILDQVANHHQRVIHVYSKEGDIIEGLPNVRKSPIKAFVNIMYGCDKFCAYCIVPYTRGRIRSRSKEDILMEINNLKNSGYKEITLLGQNVNSYGIDFNSQYRFADLLLDVAKTGIPRIRFATSNPWNFDDTIINVMKNNANIMPYIHLPIQSGDEKILKAMNRQMKIIDYINKIKKIRRALPTCSISTDLIVGFPNESEAQFKNTLNLYNKIKFDNAYAFIYSPREGTPAALLKDTVTTETKVRRLAQLNEIVRKWAKWNNEKWVGKVIDVLCEGVSKTNTNVLTGYSPEWKVINFTGVANIGDMVKVKITSASRFSLNGVII